MTQGGFRRCAYRMRVQGDHLGGRCREDRDIERAHNCQDAIDAAAIDVTEARGNGAVLDEAREIADRSDLVFPAPTGRVLSDTTLSKLLRELGIGAVPHGFRSSFRDWAAERTDVPREVCELALAHVNSDRVEAAYRRTDLFDRRLVLIND